ncbi:sugar ABC transporter permease [Rugosimonospora acidiphila]|uniref:Sugar ABC transporter permease n=1 Tax=Rugosimonospora acidiphila TaxID=556531 RepID=A0ABP9S5R4_9ACTN
MPALLIFSVFTLLPTLYTFFISLFNWNPLNVSQSTFIGFDNYQKLFGASKPSLLSSGLTSLYFTAGMVIGGSAISLAIALLLQRGGKVLAGVRLAVFVPHATPLVATSIVWVWIFNPQFGLANAALHLFGIHSVEWLNSSTWAMPSVLIYSLWHEVGFTVVVFLGGLTLISPELSEAAQLDGANKWQEFRSVTWPQLRPVTLFVIVITTITSLQAFTQFYLMTRGGPVYATTTLSFLLYQEAFVFFHTGYAAALAVVLFAVTALFTLVQLGTSRSSRGAA